MLPVSCKCCLVMSMKMGFNPTQQILPAQFLFRYQTTLEGNLPFSPTSFTEIRFSHCFRIIRHQADNLSKFFQTFVDIERRLAERLATWEAHRAEREYSMLKGPESKSRETAEGPHRIPESSSSVPSFLRHLIKY